MPFDEFKEECGVVAVWNHKEAANIAYLALYAQQHRGQEGAGVASLQKEPGSKDSGAKIRLYKGPGLVADVFENFDFTTLAGKASIGHVRYTTAGGEALSNIQPLYAEIAPGKVALAHNGNLTNADDLKQDLISKGAIFAGTSDTEVIIHLLARTQKSDRLAERVISALKQVSGAYSLVIMFEDRIIAVRDPQGFRPLSLGELDGGYILASETCAFDLVNAKYVRDVAPGEVLEISDDGIRSYFPFGIQKEAACIFEYIYFARPDSMVFGKTVYPVRKKMGEELAVESPVEGADVIIPVQDSGTTAAIGYSQKTGIPLELGLIRNHYVGRTFIEPKQSIRDFGVKIKLNANSDVLKGKSVVVVDDSIVRGTTSKKLVTMIRAAGAREVHMRISSPPITDPCFYGIDTPEKNDLIASKMSVDEIAKYIGADSLAYLSEEGLYRAVNGTGKAKERSSKFCDACFTGKYPVEINKKARQKELF